MLTAALAPGRRANAVSTSMSRMTSGERVTERCRRVVVVQRLQYAAREPVLAFERLIRSVTVPIATPSWRQDRRASSRRNTAGAFVLT